MAHFLLRKRALDAVNQELAQPTDYPAQSGKDWNSPWAAKGTEFDPTKMGKAHAAPEVSRTQEFRQSIDRASEALARAEHLSPDNASRQAIWSMLDQIRRFQMSGMARTAGGSVDYVALAKSIQGALALLASVAPKGSELQIFAENSASDMSDFIASARRRAERAASLRRRAEIRMHEDPRVLPPRDDMRTHLDADVKKEIDDYKEASRSKRSSDDDTVFYHGTSSKLIAKIRREGLLASARKRHPDSDDYVYLTKDRKVAEEFGFMACQELGGQATVITVEIPDDALDNLQAEDYGDQNYREMPAWAFEGDIPPAWIKAIKPVTQGLWSGFLAPRNPNPIQD